MVVVTVRRERRWTSAGETPDRELDRSTAAPIDQLVERSFCQRWLKRGVNCWGKVVNSNNLEESAYLRPHR
jgi:hypothetical protein